MYAFEYISQHEIQIDIYVYICMCMSTRDIDHADGYIRIHLYV